MRFSFLQTKHGSAIKGSNTCLKDVKKVKFVLLHTTSLTLQPEVGQMTPFVITVADAGLYRVPREFQTLGLKSRFLFDMEG